MKISSHISLLSLFCLLSAASVFASSPRANTVLNRLIYNNEKSLPPTAHTYSTLSSANDDGVSKITHYPLIIEIKQSEDADKILSDLGAVVYYNRGSLYLTSVPVENLDRLPRDNGIDNFHISTPLAECLDVAIPLGNVDKVHSRLSTFEKIGDNNLHNVVTGICDVGFDPRHEVFTNCLKKWVIYDEYHGMREEYEGYDNIVANGPLTDNINNSHATHVGGILAGFAEGSPYYGVAPSSDFVATTSRLSDVGICAGIEDVIRYAAKTGRRAVVNISAGSYLGPHDGKDLVGRYLTALSEDAIICFSAGNYGERNNCQSLNLDDYTAPFGSAWCDSSWLGFHVSGGTDFWSRDDSPFEFRLVAWQQDERKYLYVSDWMGGDGKRGEYFFNLEDTPWFTSGGVWATWGIDPVNNRFNVALEYDYENDTFEPGTPWTNNVVGYHIRKVVDGTHVDVYSDGIYSFLHGMTIEGCKGGTPDGSISNLASCPEVVAVGSWNSRSLVPDIDYGTIDWGFKTNVASSWSSWGTSGDGRKLPHFSAPGNTVVSAMSAPNKKYGELEWELENTAFVHDGHQYFAQAGTSMSSPYAAGVIALWLEEAPNLTVYQIQEIAMTTANRNFEDIDNPRWGAGALDALAGFEEIKRQSGVSANVSESGLKPVVRVNNGKIDVNWPGVSNPETKIYDIAGRELLLNEALTHAVVIVKVSNPDTGERHLFKLKI